MDKEIRSILARLPNREFEIKRRCTQDSSFRSICTDYEDAATALRYWQERAEDKAREADGRVAEYTSLLDELEAEILVELDHARPSS